MQRWNWALVFAIGFCVHVTQSTVISKYTGHADGDVSSWCIGMQWCGCEECATPKSNKKRSTQHVMSGSRPLPAAPEQAPRLPLKPRKQNAQAEYPAIAEAVTEVLKRLPEGKLKKMFPKCYTNTLDTTVTDGNKGTVGLVTGDIDAMWLRDSSAQLHPYVRHASSDGKLKELMRKVMQKQWECMLTDPYANACNIEPKPFYPDQDAGGPGGHTNKQLRRSERVFTGNYEMDSLAYPIWLAHAFWKATGDTNIFDDTFERVAVLVMATLQTEQQHHDRSPYIYPELSGAGRGGPLNFTGMSWAGFRPSDDKCQHGFNIPGNMFNVVMLWRLEEICIVTDRLDLASRAQALAAEMEEGIEKFGVYQHPKFGKIYSYETDGFGHHALMDDANVPSLLSIPYIGYRPVSDPIYQQTRQFVLSPDNPHYHSGSLLRGVGSPHTPGPNVWPMSLVMQGLTSTDLSEVKFVLEQLQNSDDNTGLMHESVHVNNSQIFTRHWFSWANSLFGELVEGYVLGEIPLSRTAATMPSQVEQIAIPNNTYAHTNNVVE